MTKKIELSVLDYSASGNFSHVYLPRVAKQVKGRLYKCEFYGEEVLIRPALRQHNGKQVYTIINYAL